MTRPIFVCLLICLAFLWPLVEFFSEQSLQPEYQAFPLVMAAIVVLGWRRNREFKGRELSTSSASTKSPWDRVRHFALAICRASVLAAAGIGFLVSVVLWSPWLSMLSLILLMSGILLRYESKHSATGMWGVWGLMWLLLPLPLSLDKRLTNNLQLISSWISSQLLESLGILHLLRGNVLRLETRDLFVDEACSGIVSMITIISAIAIFCVATKRTLIHTICLIVLGICWTVLMNSLRIATIAAVLVWWNIDWSAGVTHTVLAAVMFTLSLPILWLMDRFLFELLRPIDDARNQVGYTGIWMSDHLVRFWDKAIAHDQSASWVLAGGAPIDIEFTNQNATAAAPADSTLAETPSIARHRILPWSMVGIMLLGILWQGALIPRRISSAAIESGQPGENLVGAATLLDDEANPCALMTEAVLQSFKPEERKLDDIWGQYSRIWTYSDQGQRLINVSLDFPFGPRWHDLRICYFSSGWQVEEYRVEQWSDESSATGQSSVISFVISRDNGATKGLVTYLGFRPSGEVITRSSREPNERLPQLIARAWEVARDRFQDGQDASRVGSYFQLQAVHVGPEVSPAARTRQICFLLAARRALAEQLDDSEQSITNL